MLRPVFRATVPIRIQLDPRAYSILDTRRMAPALAFLAGLFCANGIPHFTNGVSGRDFHDPMLRRLFPDVPSPLFNVLWGLLNFAATSPSAAPPALPTP